MNKFKNRLLKKITEKKQGDGHYIAIAVTILLAIVIGVVVYDCISDSSTSGLIPTLVNQVTGKIKDFIDSLTLTTT